MFGFSMGEVAIIFIVALLVFGPEKMPGLARALGRAIGELKSALTEAQSHIQGAIKEAGDGEQGGHATGAGETGKTEDAEKP